MAKVTWRNLKADDPIFTQGPKLFAPVSRPSTRVSTKSTAGVNNPTRPETEEDGIRAEAIGRSKVRQMSKGRQGQTKP